MSDVSSSERGAAEGGRSEALSWYGEPLDEVVDELVGTTLSGTYEVTRVLGEGAMGRVYEAHHQAHLHQMLLRRSDPRHECARSRRSRPSISRRPPHSCEDVLELLDEANRDGDRRTVAVLSLLGDGSRKGCGPAGRRPCPAKCDGAARARLREVRTSIRERG